MVLFQLALCVLCSLLSLEVFSGLEGNYMAFLWMLFFVISIRGKSLNYIKLERVYIGIYSVSILALYCFPEKISSLHLINFMCVGNLLAYLLCSGFAKKKISLSLMALLFWTFLNQAYIYSFFTEGRESFLVSIGLMLVLSFIFQFIFSEEKDYLSTILLARPALLLISSMCILKYIGMRFSSDQSLALHNLILFLLICLELFKTNLFKDQLRKLSLSMLLMLFSLYSLYCLDIINSDKVFLVACMLMGLQFAFFQSKENFRKIYRISLVATIACLLLGVFMAKEDLAFKELSFVFGATIGGLGLNNSSNQLKTQVSRYGMKLSSLQLSGAVIGLFIVLGGALWR